MVDCAHAIRCRNTRKSSLIVILPSIDGISAENLAAIASLEMVTFAEIDMVVMVVFLYFLNFCSCFLALTVYFM